MAGLLPSIDATPSFEFVILLQTGQQEEEEEAEDVFAISYSDKQTNAHDSFAR